MKIKTEINIEDVIKSIRKLESDNNELKLALRSVIKNDKTIYHSSGEHTVNSRDESPGGSSRWNTPKEIAEEALKEALNEE